MERSEDAPDLDVGSDESVTRWRDAWDALRQFSREALARQVSARQEARRLRGVMREGVGDYEHKVLGPQTMWRD